MANFAHAARLLWEPIPGPAKKPAKIAKTWKTLELGRELRVLTKWFDGKDWIQVGTCFVVEKPITNQGVTLRQILEPAEGFTTRVQFAKTIKWTRDWKGTFEKVRKKPQRKKKA